MESIEARTALLNRCVEVLPVEEKKLFGAQGRAKDGKVFAMITKHGEFVVKCDDEDQFLGLQAEGAQRWRPHPSRGPMGRWLVLTDAMLVDEALVQSTVEHCFHHLNTD